MLTIDFKINELKTKLSYWKSNGRQELLGNVELNEQMFASPFGTISTPSGYYYLSDNLVGYYDLNVGSEFRIKKISNDKDWNCFTSLVDIANSTNDFRIVKSTVRKVIDIDKETWEYAEISTPNNEHGTTFEDEVFAWPALTDGLVPNASITDADRANTVALYKEIIDQRNIILPHIKNIANANGVGIPLEICNSSALYKDSNGYFWSDLDYANWIIPVAAFDKISQDFLLGTCGIAVKTGMMTKEQVGEILAYAGGV